MARKQAGRWRRLPLLAPASCCRVCQLPCPTSGPCMLQPHALRGQELSSTTAQLAIDRSPCAFCLHLSMCQSFGCICPRVWGVRPPRPRPRAHWHLPRHCLLCRPPMLQLACVAARVAGDLLPVTSVRWAPLTAVLTSSRAACGCATTLENAAPLPGAASLTSAQLHSANAINHASIGCGNHRELPFAPSAAVAAAREARGVPPGLAAPLEQQHGPIAAPFSLTEPAGSGAPPADRRFVGGPSAGRALLWHALPMQLRPALAGTGVSC